MKQIKPEDCRRNVFGYCCPYLTCKSRKNYHECKGTWCGKGKCHINKGKKGKCIAFLNY